MQKEFIGKDSLKKIQEIIDRTDTKNIFLVYSIITSLRVIKNAERNPIGIIETTAAIAGSSNLFTIYSIKENIKPPKRKL